MQNSLNLLANNNTRRSYMQGKIYIFYTDKNLKRYAEKIKELIKDCDRKKMLPFKAYKSLDKDDLFNEENRIIFIGTINLLDELAIPNIKIWKYKEFGCRIGWAGNKCVISASPKRLHLANYNGFKEACLSAQDEHDFVVVPPENLFNAWFTKEGNSLYEAQYSFLVVQFMDLYDLFASPDPEDEGSAEIPESMLDMLRKTKEKIDMTGNMTEEQKKKCNSIIHTASALCSAVAFVPIPAADAIPMTSIQIGMIIRLGTVFDKKEKITESEARVALKAAAAPLVGTAIARNLLFAVPGAGWVIKGAVAGVITEILGWSVANDFATKSEH
jgi:uncharacterized protein (DUF697 family)